MKEIIFYDAKGEPIAYLDDEQAICLFSGEVVAYVDDASVYAFSGRHLGRFEDGWIRDHLGRGVLFTADAHGEPLRPNIHHTLPKKAIKSMKPYKQPHEKPALPVKKSSSWSKVAGLKFFQIERAK